MVGGFVVVIGVQVLMWFRVKRALGLRADWKRRFEKMKEMLGL